MIPRKKVIYQLGTVILISMNIIYCIHYNLNNYTYYTYLNLLYPNNRYVDNKP